MSDIITNLPWNKKIKVLRTIKGWSQEEAADKCFTNQKTYWLWESENSTAYPNKNSRRAIANAFGVSEEDIFEKDQ